MKKERLENITLPFRVIGPALTILIFLAQIGFGVFWFYFRKADDQSNKNVQWQYEQIKNTTDEIKNSVKELTSTVKENDRYTREWRIQVEREMQRGDDRERRIVLLEGIVYQKGRLR